MVETSISFTSVEAAWTLQLLAVSEVQNFNNYY